MKELLALVSLVVSGVVAEAPYPPSGYRPNGPTFELPQRNPQKQQYLPPLDPRNPSSATPSQEYGPPEVDVSVQGLPTQEQLPVFQASPINGQQYVGPNFNKDIRNLDQNLRQSQTQQENYRQLARQRQLEAQANNANRQNQQVPRQFAPRTTVPTQTTLTTASTDDFRTTIAESTTEAINLNQGETVGDAYAAPAKQTKDKVTVEVSQQKIQEFPPELFLQPIAQFNQGQFVPVQLGQIRAPVYFQPAQGVSQKQVAGYDGATHFAALPSILAQQQLLQSQQTQQQFVPNSAYVVPNSQQQSFIAQKDEQQQVLSQYQPVNQYQPSQYEQIPQVQSQVQPQIQAQPVFFQPQINQVQPTYGQPQPQDQNDQVQTQFVNQGQPQPQLFNQPQGQPQLVYQQYQPQYQQPSVNQYQQSSLNQLQYQQPLLNQYQPQQPLATAEQIAFYQQQILQLQAQRQDGSLQSGLDVNQQGNGVDQTDNKEDGDDDDDGTTATAVATAFGTRTQPRVYSTYGAPAPVPAVQANPGYPTTTEPNTQDEDAEEGTTAAEATAVARGNRRKSAKQRSRRVRPIFTLDKSGHLVLSQEQ